MTTEFAEAYFDEVAAPGKAQDAAEKAQAILRKGSCDGISCSGCWGRHEVGHRCEASRADGHIPISDYGGLDAKGRAFFEEKLMEAGRPVKIIARAPDGLWISYVGYADSAVPALSSRESRRKEILGNMSIE